MWFSWVHNNCTYITVICGICEYLRLKRLEKEEQKKELERKRKLDMFN